MGDGELELVVRHLKTLRIASIAAWLLTILLLYTSSLLPLFDSSPRVVFPRHTIHNFLVSPLLRWDVFHFVHIALDGYVYEYEWAFLPGIAKTVRWTSAMLQQLGIMTSAASPRIGDVLLPAALLSCLCDSTVTLYHLTLLHFGSPSLAYLTALLSLLPSSPASLRFSVYTEPFFAYLSYKGMLSCARSNWLQATLFFALAASFRSNGFMLAGFVIWGLIAQPLLYGQVVPAVKATKAMVATATIFTPFVLHQYTGYLRFCTNEITPSRLAPPWCSSTLPSIYSYVQAKYWNVGFLRYWTTAQFPNILLAAPVLLCLLSFVVAHLRTCTLPLFLDHPWIRRTPFSQHLRAICTPARSKTSPFFPPSVVPHVIHAFATSCILLFAAHTQIALRQAASMPTTYWAAAWLMAEHPRAGKWWVTWSVLWGAISVVLLGVFLPPA